MFESTLLGGWQEAASGQPRGYTLTSAINRYLDAMASTFDIDVFLIDTSPALGLLNHVIFLGSDMFIVPVAADSFSVQGVDNMGKVLAEWKQTWKATAGSRYVYKETPADRVLPGDPVFIGYIENGYNVYKGRPVNRQGEWLNEVRDHIKTSLSPLAPRGMEQRSWQIPLGQVRDLGQLTAISMESHQAIQEFVPGKVPELNLQGTKQLWEQAVCLLHDTGSELKTIFENY